MPKSITLSPALSEVKIKKNVVSTDFNGMHIEYTMPEDRYLEKNPIEVRKALRDAIALSSKLYHPEELLNDFFKWDGTLKVTNAETGEQLYATNVEKVPELPQQNLH